MSHTEINEELSGVHGLNFAFMNSSSARSVMFASHFSQRLVTKGCDQKIIQTGMEYELAKYSFDIKMPKTGMILKVIERYRPGVDVDAIAYNPETLVIYEDYQTGEIGAFSIPHFQSYHQYFGFRNVFREENIRRLIPGTVIEEGAIFAASSSIAENGNFKFGTTMNMAFMSHPAVSEDGIMISKSALKKLEFSVFETRVVEFGNDTIPLNIYGDENNYKAFPEIGEKIKDNGILMALRKLDEENSPVELRIQDTMEPDYIFDTAYYARGPGGTIVDITIYHNDSGNNLLPEQITSGMAKYVKGYRQFYKDLLDTERDIRQQRIRKYGADNTVISPYLHRLLVEGYALLDPQEKKHGKKLTYTYRKATLPEYRIVFKIEYVIRPTVGFKMSDMQGGKGVICRVEEDENMPVDAHGNRAEVVMDSGSTINRMNLSRLYEQYLGAASRDIRKQICSILEYNGELPDRTLKMLQKFDQQKIQQARTLLLDFISLISEPQRQFIESLNQNDLIEYLRDIVCDKLYLYYPINNDKEITFVIESIQQKYPPCYSPITYTGISGQKVTTERNVRIGPLYMMLLEKIADDWSAVSYGRMQHYGVLSLMTKSEKYTFPFRNNPVRTIGETEGRVFVGYCGQETIAEMMDRSNSPTTQKNLIYNILSAQKPSNIDYVINRQTLSYGGSKPLALINHIFMCSGFKFTYRPENYAIQRT
jgi:DNA-directed RNA polymerase beta subunit